MTIAGLLKNILDDQQPFWAAQFEDWLRSSRRFRTFAETYRDKIRKKLRISQNESSLLDLFFELETAYRFIDDQRFVVEYEKHGLLKTRAPDFTIAFRVNTIFNLEVTRLRMPQADTLTTEEIENVTARKLGDSVCDKLGQMRPSSINILLIVSSLPINHVKLLSVMNALRLVAEQKQDAFFVQSGYQDARDFLRQLQQLSAIVCRSLEIKENSCWLNPLAKHPIPKELHNVLQKILAS